MLDDERKKLIDDVFNFCRGTVRGVMKEMVFQKIAPVPDYLEEGTKEKDDWLLNNWGTRDVAYNACWISDNEMIFDTFWHPAIPIVYRIMKQFPNIDFTFKFSSDKTGANVGQMYTYNGNIFFSQEKDFSRFAYEIAFELRPHLQALYVLNMTTDNYEYDTSDIMSMVKANGFYKEADGTILMGLDDKKKPLFDDLDDLPF